MDKYVPETKRFILTMDDVVIDQDDRRQEITWWKQTFLEKSKKEESLFNIKKSSDSIFDLIERGDLVNAYDQINPPEVFLAGDFILNKKSERIGISDFLGNKIAFFEDVIRLYKNKEGNFVLYYESFITDTTIKN